MKNFMKETAVTMGTVALVYLTVLGISLLTDVFQRDDTISLLGGLIAVLAGATFKSYLDRSFGKTGEERILNCFAVIYGMSPCFIVPDGDVRVRLVFVILPIVLMAVEKIAGLMERRDNAVTESMVCVGAVFLLLLLIPIDAIPVIICLMVYILAFLFARGERVLLPILSVGCMILLSFMLSAFFVFPVLKDHSQNAVLYEGYYYHYIPVDMTLIPVVLFFIYVFCAADRRKVAANLVTLGFVMAGMLTGFFSFLFSFGLYGEGQTYAFDLFFVFLLLRMGCEGAVLLERKEGRKVFIVKTALAFIGASFVLLFTHLMAGRFAKISDMLWGIAELALGIVLFYVIQGKERKKASGLFLTSLLSGICIVLALFFDTGVRYDLDDRLLFMEFENRLEETKGAFASADDSAENVATRMEAEPDGGMHEGVYNEFVRDHYDGELMYVLNLLNENVDITDAEIRTYSDKIVTDELDRLNALCRKIGCTSDLIIGRKNCEPEFEDGKDYLVTRQGGNVYNVEFFLPADYAGGTTYYLPFTLDLEEETGDVYLYNSYSGTLIRCEQEDVDGKTVLYTDLLGESSETVNFCLQSFSVDRTVYEDLKERILDKIGNSKRGSSLGDMMGLILSFVGVAVFLLLFLGNKRDKTLAVLREKLYAFSISKPVSTIWDRFVDNKVYLAAFFLPATFMLLVLILNDCAPFGPNAIFHSDGAQLMIPSLWEAAATLNNGNRFLSMNGGYGYNLYSNNCLIDLYKYLGVFSPEKIVSALSVAECMMFGVGAVGFVFYLTHRRFQNPADKHDWRLLVGAFVYVLNSFMLSMHIFPTWYLNFVLFPFLILSFERMVTEKKVGAYGVLLLLSMINNVQLAMYTCIFLVLYFLSAQFEGIKDFLIKGVRFAIISVVSVFPGSFVVHAILSGTNDSAYRGNDSVLPTLSFHKSFFDQWKQFWIFAPMKTVDSDDGGLNVYIGIVSLILFFVFLFAKDKKKKERLRLLPLLLFLLLSFNGNVLSYLWNGFHYQTLVPNRYAFLLVFLLAILCYEGMTILHAASRKRIVLSCGCVLLLFLVCEWLGTEKRTWSFVVSVSILAFSFAILLLSRCREKWLFFLLVSEMMINGIYAFSGMGLNEITGFGDYERESEVIRELLDVSGGYYRVGFPNLDYVNPGAIYNVPSVGLFNSYVTRHQTLTAYSHGFLMMTNAVLPKSNATPVGNDLAGIRYLLVSKRSTAPVLDLERYPYVGYDGFYFVYENKDAFPLGIYVPENVTELAEVMSNTIDFQNGISKMLGGEQVLSLGLMEYGEGHEEYVEFYNSSGNKISIDEAKRLAQEAVAGGERNEIASVRMHLHITPQYSGKIYLYDLELVPVGEAIRGEVVDFWVPAPNSIIRDDGRYNYAILLEDAYDSWVKTVNKNRMQNVSVKHDVIRGETDYDEDGYTMFSVAYDPGYTAYVDGEEAEVEDLIGTVAFVKTPAGKHEVILKYEPPGRKLSLTVSMVAFFADLLLLILYWYMQKKKNEEILNKNATD